MDDGREAFVHYSAIQAKGYRKLAEGDVVEFDIEKGPKGLKAENVVVLEHAIQKTGYLHFELWNCGNNVPRIQGNAFAIVAQQFDMRHNPTTGLISGAIYGSDHILCGNVNSTQRLVTEHKAMIANALSATGSRPARG